MEYLHPHVIMRKGLIRGIEYPRFADDIAEFLASTLFSTSVLAGTAAEHKARAELFAPNIALCKITEDLVFTDPYREAALNRWTRPYLDAEKRAFERDGPLKVAAQARKYQFMTSVQALIHGDLHTGSIMATLEDTRVIDPEFAFIGPIGFDVGAVIGNLLLAFFAHEGHEAAPAARDVYRDWILMQAEKVWSGFHRRFLELWRAAPSGDAYPASLFPSDGDRAAMDKERARSMRVLFEDSLGRLDNAFHPAMAHYRAILTLRTICMKNFPTNGGAGAHGWRSRSPLPRTVRRPGGAVISQRPCDSGSFCMASDDQYVARLGTVHRPSVLKSQANIWRRAFL